MKDIAPVDWLRLLFSQHFVVEDNWTKLKRKLTMIGQRSTIHYDPQIRTYAELGGNAHWDILQGGTMVEWQTDEMH